MNKKILIGSIIAICILIGVLFTSVVGYRNIDSDVDASPLFNIRTSRAIDEESSDLSCKYVGKGEENILFIPKRDNTTWKLYKFKDLIRTMDDKTLNKFINVIYQFKTNEEHYKINNIPAQITGQFWECTYGENYWYPGCILFSLISALLFYFVIMPISLIRFFLNLNTIGQRITFCTCNYLCE